MLGKPFILVNLHQHADELLVEHGPSGMLAILLKRDSQRSLPTWMRDHKELMRKLPADPYIHTGLHYALNSGQGEAETIIEASIEVYPALSTKIMTAARQLENRGEERGIQQGIQRGIQQGIQTRNIEIAKNMLASGLDVALIIQVTGLNLEDIKQLQKK